MRLRVYSLKKVLYDGEAKSLNAKTETGEITVLHGHCPLIAMLRPGTLKIVDNNETSYTIAISSGFLEARPRSEVTILAEE